MLPRELAIKELHPATIPMPAEIIIKYKGDQPEFLFEIAGNDIGLKEYTKHEIIEIINTPEWKTES